MPNGFALDFIFQHSKCETYVVCSSNFCGSGAGCGDGAWTDEELDIPETEWGQIGVQPTNTVLAGPEQEE